MSILRLHGRTMDSELNINIQEFPIDYTGSLLSKHALSFIERLEAFVQGLPQNQEVKQGVVLLQRGDRSDLTTDWLLELQEESLLDELYLRILRLRRLIESIRLHNSTWVYASEGSAMGLYFDLALACDLRFSFRVESLFGYPDIVQGIWPFGGQMEQETWRRLRGRRAWLKEPCMVARRAKTCGFIDYVSDQKEWRREIMLWFRNHLIYEVPEEKPFVEKRSKERSPEGEVEFFRHAFNVIAKAPLIQAGGRQSENAFDLGWGLVKSSPKQLPRQDLGYVLAYISAQQSFRAEYQSWLERFVALKTQPVENVSDSNVVYIDVDYLVPPVQCFLRLVERKITIAFVGMDPGTLKEALGLMFVRVERELGPKDAAILWRDSVIWFVGKIEPARGPVLRWTLDDKVFVLGEFGQLELLRFLGNRGRADCGWAEIKMLEGAPGPNEALLPLAALISDGIVRSKPVGKGQIRLSTFIRSVFLEEIIRVSRSYSGGLAKALESLAEEGWEFIGEEAAWEPFLRARQSSYVVDAGDVRLGSLQIGAEAWKLVLWKQVRELVKRTKSSEVLFSNATSLSFHFATLAGITTQLIISSELVDDQRAANALVCQALGFPKALGTPLFFAEARGSERLVYYGQQYWPSFVGEAK